MGWFKDMAQREFGWENMQDRASRSDALADVQYSLSMWRDYGDPADLGAAIERLRLA